MTKLKLDEKDERRLCKLFTSSKQDDEVYSEENLEKWLLEEFNATACWSTYRDYVCALRFNNKHDELIYKLKTI
jgi:hypothetical protein